MRLMLQNIVADDCICTCLVTHAGSYGIHVRLCILAPFVLSVQVVCHIRNNACHIGNIAEPASCRIASTTCLSISVTTSISPSILVVQSFSVLSE